MAGRENVVAKMQRRDTNEASQEASERTPKPSWKAAPASSVIPWFRRISRWLLSEEDELEDETGGVDESALSLNDLRLIVRVQNRYRAVRLSAYHFAPTYFRSHDGLPAVHGQLSFEQAKSYQFHQSPYLVLASSSSPSLINRLLVRFWGLPEPELIIDVTGSAQDMLLDQSNEYALRRALTILSKLGNVWVISSGTDTGIMKILGSTIRAIETDEVHIPLIGIVPLMMKVRMRILEDAD